jgi:Carboxypeptidase regulatory-like domain
VRIFGRTSAAALAVALSLGVSLTAHAQGVYTAAVQGTVRGTNNEPLPNVSIVLTNQATGDRWDATTTTSGRYAIENVAVGGPYTLRARRVGFAAAEQTRITLGLGQWYVADLTLQPAAVPLQTVQITSAKSLLSDATRTGPSSTISDSLVHSEPTIDRDFQSLLQMQPEVSVSQGSLSIAGENNRFNNILIDGSVNNDLFGLADNGLPGGACRNPWQDIINGQSLELSWDIFNVPNLLDRNWGLYKQVTPFEDADLLYVQSFDATNHRFAYQYTPTPK